ncbi:MAG TPA: gliding motility-associated C-terminal domain-containing protein [Ohtaekwangia sp.]
MSYNDGTTTFNLAGISTGHTVPVSPTVNTTYTIVSVSDATTCAGAGGSATTITVNPVPVATIASSPSPICLGQSSTLTFTLTGTGPFNVSYSDGTTTFNLTGINTGHTVPVSPTANTTYTIVGVSDATTCTGAAGSATTVNVIPVPVATISSSPSPICSGQSSTLTFTLTGTGPFDVSYNDGSTTFNLTGINTGHTVSVSPTVNTTYTIISVTDASVCPGTGGSTTTINVTPLPNANFGGLNASYCLTEPSATLTPVTPGGTFSGPGISGNVFDPSVAGAGTHTIQYSITVSGCTSVATQNVDVLPVPDATINAAGPFCASDATVILTAATGGGTWSGPGITNAATGAFDPAIAGPGVKVISYQVTVGGCTSNDTQNITVFAAPNATITDPGPFCTTDAAVNLTAATAGGLWSGTGITDAVLGTFNPATAGSGSHDIIYAITVGSCSDADTITINVSTPPDATITPVGPLCTNDAAFTLTAVTAGGTWSGPGITNAATGLFNPATAGQGTHTITYSITIGGCSDTETTDIQVDQAPDATITAAGPFCTLDPAVNLVAATTGGTWSGNGITDTSLGTFNPATAGAGNHQIIYTVVNGICTDADTISIAVSTPPDASITPAGPVCTNDPAFTLSAVTAGGTWSGPGITNAATGLFNPATAGQGTHTITYSITIGGCSDTQTTDIVVNSAVNPVINPAGPFCLISTPVNLTATVPGGTWSGNGITDAVNGTFNPATAGVGSHLITYTVTGACSTPATRSIVVNPTCGGNNCFAYSIEIDTTLSKRPSCFSGSNDGVIALRISGLVPGPYIVTILNRNNGTSVQPPQSSPIGSTTHVFVFPTLSPGEYQYRVVNQVGDTCIQDFDLLVKTTVEASASGLANVTCFGEPTGQAVLTVTSGGNSPYEYSIDGTTWTTFVSGGLISNLPPNGTYNILVRDDASDVCPAEVPVTINNANPEITATFETEDATCNGGDGRIFNITPTGGSGGPYQFSLDGITYQDEDFFDELDGGTYQVRVKDNSDCIQLISIPVTSPGSVDVTVNAVNGDCSNNGNSGHIDVTINDSGVYQVALSTDPFNEPADEDYNNYTGTLPFDNLASDTYYIYVREVGNQCRPDRIEQIIEGAIPITFTIESFCSGGNQVSLSLVGITGDVTSGNPITVEVFRKFFSDPVATGVADPTNPVFTMAYDVAPWSDFLQTPGEYEIQLSQNQADPIFCAIRSERIDYTVTSPLTAFVGEVRESYPDIANGSMEIVNFSGGSLPYEIKIELDQPAVPGQSYGTDWEEVQQNSNLQYVKRYENLPAGRYEVLIRDANECLLELDPPGVVPLDTDIYIPNIITPNGDNDNSVFFIRNLPEEGAQLVITNRWGKEVYSSNNYQNNWDAEEVSDGIYFYRLRVEGGNPINGWVEVMRGNKP